MNEPEILEPDIESEDATDDDLPRQRPQGQSDPWHGLDDFEAD